MIRMNLRAALAAAVLVGVAVSSPAQRLREEIPGASVTIRPAGVAATPTPAPTPAPDPSLVIVAIVNGHSLTRAQLDRRITAITGITPEERARTQNEASQPSGAMMRVMNDPHLSRKDLLDMMLTERYDSDSIEEALQREEGFVVEQWLEQTLLADEARRHGIAISQAELRDHLARYDREFELRDESTRRLLDAFGVSRSELEASIHDALLVDRLIEKFIATNYTEEDLRKTYDAQPSLYVTPPAWRILHFVISADDADSAQMHSSYERLADTVRRELASATNHEDVIAKYTDFDMGMLGGEYTWAVNSPHLDPGIRERLVTMRPGNVSPVFHTVLRRNAQGRPMPEAYHVVKLLEILPEDANTFETALPKVRETFTEISSVHLIRMLKAGGTHRMLVNLGGIPPRLIPSPDQVAQAQPPLSLRVDGRISQLVADYFTERD